MALFQNRQKNRYPERYYLQRGNETTVTKNPQVIDKTVREKYSEQFYEQGAKFLYSSGFICDDQRILVDEDKVANAIESLNLKKAVG